MRIARWALDFTFDFAPAEMLEECVSDGLLVGACEGRVYSFLNIVAVREVCRVLVGGRSSIEVLLLPRSGRA